LQKFGVSTKNFCAARCFCGDSSDGISGAPGVGFKTLTKRISALSAEEELSVTDIVNVALELGKTSKLKIYKSITAYHDRAKLNWKLMYLGTNNLSADQINRVKFQLEQKPPKSKKLDFMRLLQKNQIVNFDVNSYFMSLNLITNNF
jgi:5'-3' exonuclease